VPWKAHCFQWVRIPPGKCRSGRYHLERFKEVTNWTEALQEKALEEGLGSRQAVTRVNVEQASKRVMWEPTRLRFGEGRRRRGYFFLVEG